MIDERQEELASLHAFGLLEGPERAAFERELAANPELRRLVDSLSESAATLALHAPPVEPPAGLKYRILEACAAAPSPAASAPPAGDKVVPFSLRRVLPWAAAAALALSTAWFALQNSGLRAENDSLRTERELAGVALKMAQNQLTERSLLAEKMITDLGQKLQRSEDLARLKVAALASLAGNSSEAKAIAVWDPDQQAGLLTVEKLPAIADTQDYQIWIVDPKYPDPVNGGVFHATNDGRIALAIKPDQPVTQAAAFAVSLEKKGGVPKAQGPILLLGK